MTLRRPALMAVVVDLVSQVVHNQVVQFTSVLYLVGYVPRFSGLFSIYLAKIGQ